MEYRIIASPPDEIEAYTPSGLFSYMRKVAGWTYQNIVELIDVYEEYGLIDINTVKAWGNKNSIPSGEYRDAFLRVIHDNAVPKYKDDWIESFVTCWARFASGLTSEKIDSAEEALETSNEVAISLMTNWFHSNFQDPVNRLTYNTREGGYLYTFGGPYDASEQIWDEFGDLYSAELIERAVDRVQEDGIYEWDSVERPGDYGEEEPPDDFLDLSPSKTTLSPPDQDLGPRWRYDEGRVVPDVAHVTFSQLTHDLHAVLRQSVRNAQQSCATLRNKFPDLWASLSTYSELVDVDTTDLSELPTYVAGLDLETRFRLSRDMGENPTNEYPELSLSEASTLEQVIRLHAPFIQSTPLGSRISSLADQENRTPGQTRQLAADIVTASNALLKHPNLIDASAVQLLRDNVTLNSEDPKFYRRVTLSQVGIKNLSIVMGTIAIISVAPVAAGALVGGIIGGASGLVGAPLLGAAAAGSVTGGTIGKALMPWFRSPISDSKPFQEVKEGLTNSLNNRFSLDTSRGFRSIRDLYIGVRDLLMPVAGSPGIDEWFDALHSDLDEYGDVLLDPLDPSSYAVNNYQSGPQYPLGVLYENSAWRVDIEGMSALDGSREFSIGNIFAVSEWSMSSSEKIDLYHAPMHMSLKSRTNLDEFVNAWLIALDAHSSSSGSHKLRPEVLEATLDDLSKNKHLNQASINQFQQFIVNLADNPFV
ncbi:hypothetical protein [Hellea balneolensis]|uniref:hypothetical protein n=1 Tax=Hellea balneolensis TaxID=287478 RepID=UPI0004137131|nr:hypothetical protein [Hellea balneolensis]